MAGHIIVEGTDLAMKRALDMSERDLRQRGRMLDELAAKWQTPNPKPRPRRVLAKPEAFLLEVGDCLRYPASRGSVRNPYVGPRQEASYYALYTWDPDGWGPRSSSTATAGTKYSPGI